jgi:diguanylate cyclase (GGDEF)-like protein
VGRWSPAGRAAWAWVAFVVVGLTATACYAADIAAVAAFAAVGLGAVAALAVGPRWHRARPRTPWRLMCYAAATFLVGALVRPVVADADGVTVLLADLFTLPGYLLMIFSLASFLHARRGVHRHALIDGLIVCTGAAVASTLLFALPAAAIPGRDLAVSVVAAVYPLLDAVLLLLVVNLAFTTAVRRPSFVLLVVTMSCMFVGDVGYAVIGASGELYASPLLDLPFLLGFTMLGASALHPSAADMVRVAPLPIQAWSWPRLLVLLPALAAPFVLTAAIPSPRTTERLVLAGGGALVVTLLLARAVAAVQSYAATQREYRHQATHDPLTGLPNRRMLSIAVERMLAAGPVPDAVRIWMFFLDLDDFKFVNDSWGHTAGDQLIVDVGRRLRDAVPRDATVARLGGDEFVVLTRCTEDAAMTVAEQIMGCVQQPLTVASAEVTIGASMGIASAVAGDGAEVTVEALMRDADTAMYRTKSARRGAWTVFDTSMHQAVRERIELEAALRTALAAELLDVAYQPIVELAGGRPVGAEALARWTHPVRGPISPAVFIPIAEESRLIATLGTWVLRRSLRQLAAWRDAGVVGDDFWMSVNVSPRQLDAELPALLAEELTRGRVPARCVVLEITESVMVDACPLTDRVLAELRDLGVRISVDDFGTGFSALGYLRRHPVTGVKVDRSFVSGLGVNASDEEIVRAVVAMSAALGLSVVAEGVETTGQRDVLAGLGVTLGQGWLWGAAVEPQRFAAQWGAIPDAAPAGGPAAGAAVPHVLAGNS